MGNLGGGAARFAKKAGLRIVGVRRTGRSHRYVDEMYTPRDLPKLLPKADFVLCAAPLTAATEHLIGRRELGLMKPTAGIINVGRAGVIDYDALVEKRRQERSRNNHEYSQDRAEHPETALPSARICRRNGNVLGTQLKV